MNKFEIAKILHSKDEELLKSFINSNPVIQLEALKINKSIIDEYQKNKMLLENQWERLLSEYYTLQNLSERLNVSLSDLSAIDNFEIDSDDLLSDKMLHAYQKYLCYLIDVRQGKIFTFSLDKNVEIKLMNIRQLKSLMNSKSDNYDEIFNYKPDYVKEFHTLDELLNYTNKLSIPDGTEVYVNNILLNNYQYEVKKTYLSISEKVVKSLVTNKKINTKNVSLV